MLRFDAEHGLIIDTDTSLVAAFVSRSAHERHPDLAKQMALAPEMVVALKRCVETIDTLFAMVVDATHNSGGMDPFFPSKSGEPWVAMRAAHDLIKRVEG
jgi:hypothetical protein